MRLYEIESASKIKTAIRFAVDKFRHDNTAIYKGSSNYSEDDGLFFRDPTAYSGPRVSANTHNYATLWIDNSRAWTHLPPRSHSLICSTSIKTASAYGSVAVVIPITDAKIGICSAPDFWDAFPKTMPQGASVDDLNAFLNMVIRDQLGKNPDKHKLTYEDFLKLLRRLRADELEREDDWFPELVIEYGWKGMLDHVLDPKANDFQTTTWKRFNLVGDREVWLSSPCMMLGLARFRALVQGNMSVDELIKEFTAD